MRFTDRLKKHGWDEAEIQRAQKILFSEEKQEKHIEYSKSSNKILYWTDLIVLTIANFMISVILIPFLLVLKGMYLYAIVIVLGFVFGFIFNFLITDIEHLEYRHHLFAAIFIPLIGIIDIFIMVAVATDLAAIFKIILHQNPYYVAIAYVVSFMLPYLVDNIEHLLGRHPSIQESLKPK